VKAGLTTDDAADALVAWNLGDLSTFPVLCTALNAGAPYLALDPLLRNVPNTTPWCQPRTPATLSDRVLVQNGAVQSRCLTVDTSSNSTAMPVALAPCSGLASQLFFVRQEYAGQRFALAMNVSSSPTVADFRCLTPSTDSTGAYPNGTQETMQPCTGSANQYLSTFNRTDGTTAFYPQIDGNRCLDTAGAITADGAALVQGICQDATSVTQRWIVQPMAKGTVGGD
jgi:hypothetical protein